MFRYMARKRGTSRRLTLTLTCRDTTNFSVVFEPYGAEHWLVPEDAIRMEFTGPTEAELEIVCSPDCISIWPGAGTELTGAWNRLGDELGL